eukprot:Gb_10168 [translate_table: standard]
MGSRDAAQRTRAGRKAKIKGRKVSSLVEGTGPGRQKTVQDHGAYVEVLTPSTREDKNFVRKPESSDKVSEDTALLVEMENCQPEARPLGASPNLTTNSIKKLTKRLLGTDPKRPQEDKNVTFPTNRSFEEILDSVINEFLKINLTEGEDGPPCCIAEEETFTDTTEESSESSDSNEFHHRTNEPMSVRKNPLFKRKSKMASNGHPENSRPPQPNGNMSQDGNNQEELRHKQRANNTNPVANCDLSFHQQMVAVALGIKIKEWEAPDSKLVQTDKDLPTLPGAPILLTWDQLTPCPQMGATKTLSAGILHPTSIPQWGCPIVEIKLVLVPIPMPFQTPIAWEVPIPLTKVLPTQTTVGPITWDLMVMDQYRA